MHSHQTPGNERDQLIWIPAEKKDRLVIGQKILSNFLRRETHIRVTAKGSPSGTATTAVATYSSSKLADNRYKNKV